jgi:hypothetical protein
MRDSGLPTLEETDVFQSLKKIRGKTIYGSYLNTSLSVYKPPKLDIKAAT